MILAKALVAYYGWVDSVLSNADRRSYRIDQCNASHSQYLCTCKSRMLSSHQIRAVHDL